MQTIARSRSTIIQNVLHKRAVVTPQMVSQLHTSSILMSKTAGRHPLSKNRTKPLTYEQANKPDMIGVRKSWNNFNTSCLLDGVREAETSHEDVFIRGFMHGTWPKLLASDVIIKRRANSIILSFIAIRGINEQNLYFLTGYTEEILSYILKCNVKIELQLIRYPSEMDYKYI